MDPRIRKETGVLLVNLGTPDAPTPSAVRRYLREFLSDPRVVEIPRLIWWWVLNLVILPFRSTKSAKTYHSIWTDKGSPLLVYTLDLGTALREQLEREPGVGAGVRVGVGMRYGKPSLGAELESFQNHGIQRILVCPLFPQYSAATTASIFDAVFKSIRKWRYVPELHLVSDYHDDDGYLDAIATSIVQFWKAHGPCRQLLFSFHGLPERSRLQGDPYYDQCHRTAKWIAQKLDLEPSRWQVVFQSRFGPAAWLQPYCVDVLAELPKQGCTEVDIVCPGFAVDCLETLEEIAVTNRDVFLRAGGIRYRYIPALNSSPLQVAMLGRLIERKLGMNV